MISSPPKAIAAPTVHCLLQWLYERVEPLFVQAKGYQNKSDGRSKAQRLTQLQRKMLRDLLEFESSVDHVQNWEESDRGAPKEREIPASS